MTLFTFSQLVKIAANTSSIIASIGGNCIELGNETQDYRMGLFSKLFSKPEKQQALTFSERQKTQNRPYRGLLIKGIFPLFLELFQCFFHGINLLGGVSLPHSNFSDHSEWLGGAIGFGRVSWEFFVR